METSITFTSSAAAKVKQIIEEEGNPNLRLRVFVQGGGCSGFQYGFTLDESIVEDDFEIETDGIKLLVDVMSMQYLRGSTLDYVETLMGSSFSITNPNATSKCGCGSSFAA